MVLLCGWSRVGLGVRGRRLLLLLLLLHGCSNCGFVSIPLGLALGVRLRREKVGPRGFEGGDNPLDGGRGDGERGRGRKR